MWAARHRYPYIGFTTSRPPKKIKHLPRGGRRRRLRARAGELRVPAVPRADTEEKALENAKQFMWMAGEFTGLAHPYGSAPRATARPRTGRAFVEYAVGRRSNPRGAAFEDQIRDQQILAGTPKTVIPKIRRLLEETRPSILAFWASDGFVPHADTKTCIRLLGQEVLPAVREMGKDLGLWSPFEANSPVSIAYPTGPASAAA